MNSNWMEIFDRNYLPRLGIRAPTFRAVMREAVSRGLTVIVETGCTRDKDNWEGDGQSTVMWSKYSKYSKGMFTTIDISKEAIELAKEVSGGQADYYICGDSVKELTIAKDPIDLLYLDSFDVDMENVKPAAMHCMFEFCAARPRLHPGSIVFIDDTPVGADYSISGKGAYVAEYFKHLGIAPFTWGYQMAWIMP